MPVLLPNTLSEAVALKAEHPEARPMAGGTDLLVHWPEVLENRDCTWLDLSGVAELRPLRWSEDTLELGALSTYWDVEQDERARQEFPILIQAAEQVGAIQIQSRGTWAGNIANASPAADGVPVLMACDARVVLVSSEGVREIPLHDYYTGYKTMRAQPSELIQAIRVPRREYALQRFEKVGARRAQAITKVGLAVTRSNAGWRVVANSVAPTVCRCRAVEALLEAGIKIDAPEDLLDTIDDDVKPIDDIRSTARYRRTVMSRVLHGMLQPI